MSDSPGWAAWRHNADEALEHYTLALIEDAFCNGTASHDDCRGGDCNATLDHLGFTADMLAPGAAREIEEDLYGFVTSCLPERPDCFADVSAAMVGYDFYMTRNGHGVGFWDRGLGETGDWLTAMCKPFGEASVYVGDDGNLYYWNK